MGQLRVAGMGGVILGIDMNAAFATAEALGVDRRAVAELLPAIEAGLVRGCRKDQDGNVHFSPGNDTA